MIDAPTPPGCRGIVPIWRALPCSATYVTCEMQETYATEAALKCEAFEFEQNAYMQNPPTPTASLSRP